MLGTVFDSTVTPASLGVQETVAQDQTNGAYGLTANLTNLAAGETVEFQVFMKARQGDTAALAKTATFTGVQTEKVIASVFGDAMPAVYHWELRIKQTGGTLRAYPLVVWKIA